MNSIEQLKNLSMSKERKEKVYISDIAIEKVPYIEYREIPMEEYGPLQNIAKDVLRISKEKNDSNEVAIIYSLEHKKLIEKGKEYLGVSLGDEVSVNPIESPTAYHLVKSTIECVAICFHNHPNLSKLSLEDVKFFLRNESIKLMAVVTNLGAISYIVKTDRFDWNIAVDLFEEAVEKERLANNLKGLQEAAEYFLNNCHKARIIYSY